MQMLKEKNEIVRLPENVEDPKKKQQRGMTLIEIIIVITLIVLIVGVFVGPRLFASKERQEMKTTKLALQQVVMGAVQEFQMDNKMKCPKGIDELVRKKYLDEKDAEDPWGGKYTISCKKGERTPGANFGAASNGPDGKPGTDDDIKSWE